MDAIDNIQILTCILFLSTDVMVPESTSRHPAILKRNRQRLKFLKRDEKEVFLMST